MSAWNYKTVEWIDIEVTSFCNIQCPGCLRQVKNKEVNNILNKDIITLNNLKKWINKETFPNFKLLNFCGSIDEPTTHPEILDIVDHFSKISDINISSNGSTKTTNFWSTLGEYKISVFFGIDGIDQNSLEKYRIGSNYKKIKENWRSFIASGGNATWQFIAFEHNEHLIEQARHIATEEGFKHFRVIYSHRKGNNEVEKKRKVEQEIVCKYANQKRVFITHSGILLPCCFLNSEYLQTYAGNKTKTRFDKKLNELGGKLELGLDYNRPEEIIDGEMFNYITDSWKTEPIERCWNTCKQAKQDIFLHETLRK